MQSTTTSQSSCPYDRATLFSRLYMWYLIPLFSKANRQKGLKPKDLHRCPTRHRTENVVSRLAANWDRAQVTANESTPSFVTALLRTFAGSLVVPYLFTAFSVLFLQVGRALLLGVVLRYFEDYSTLDVLRVTYLEACYCAAGLCAATVAIALVDYPVAQHSLSVAIQIRTAITGLIHRKTLALRLGQRKLGHTNTGDILGLLSTDVPRMDVATFNLVHLFVVPFHTAIVVYLLWLYLGLAIFAGLALLVVLVPLQAKLSSLVARCRVKMIQSTDLRLKYMDEIIAGIKVIKLNCWERPFTDRISQTRETEVSQLRKSYRWNALNHSLHSSATRMLLFVALLVLILFGDVLDAETVFVSLVLFDQLRQSLNVYFPRAIGALDELKAGCKRIEEFLLYDQIDTEYRIPLADKQLSYIKSIPRYPYVRVHDITATWSLLVSDTDPHRRSALRNISLDLKVGDLLAVVGLPGSGKHSLLACLLHELPLQSGRIEVEGRLSYASGPQAWCVHDSVRNNVLMGAEYNADRYSKVIGACALHTDLRTLLPYGDQTVVGNSAGEGFQLTASQLTRLNLARAIYRTSDIVLLDDPFWGVEDPAMIKHIFDKCVMEMLKSKIRILITDHQQFVKQAFKVLVLKEGECVALGPYKEVKEKVDLSDLIKPLPLEKGDENKKKENTNQNNKVENEVKKIEKSLKIEKGGRLERSLKLERSVRITDKYVPMEQLIKEGEPKESNVKKKEEKKKETTEKPKASVVTASTPLVMSLPMPTDHTLAQPCDEVYADYIRSGVGRCALTLLVGLVVVSQLLLHATDIFLAYWTNQNQLEGEASQANTVRNTVIYAGLVFATLVAMIVRDLSLFACCTRASTELHRLMFTRLVRAPLAVFESSPPGRIATHFGKDVATIDHCVAPTGVTLVAHLAQFVGVIATIGVANFWLLLPGYILLVVMINLRLTFLNASRDISRYESATRNTLCSHFTDTLDGLISIRALKAQPVVERQFGQCLDHHTGTLFLALSTGTAIGIAIDLCCALFLTVCTAFLIWYHDIAAGTVGLVLCSALALTGTVQFGVRTSAQLENHMLSVEQVLEYRNLDQEASARSSRKCRPPEQWPHKGDIKFEHLSVAAATTTTTNDGCSALSNPTTKPPLLLRDINCTIFHGEKIGVVGHSNGASKSALISALFRLIEPTGTVRVDDYDIRTIGLDELRRRLAIVPRECVLFSGTVRFNLDPLGRHTDQQLWTALGQVKLRDPIGRLAGALDCTEWTHHLSDTQRRLLSVARVVLRLHSTNTTTTTNGGGVHIVVVDHQPRSVDRVVRSVVGHLPDCTVLSVASRPRSVLHCDRVAVLQDGQLVQFDSPHVLLGQPGAFRRLASAHSDSTAVSHMLQLARQAHESRMLISFTNATKE